MNNRGLIEQAKQLAQSGLSVIPIGKEKMPAYSDLPKNEDGKGYWSIYQSAIASAGEIESWGTAQAVAILGGRVSGQLVQLDFEGKDRNEEPMEPVFDEWRAIARQALEASGGLQGEALSVCKTPSGGYHVRWRVDTHLRLVNEPKVAERFVFDANGEILRTEKGRAVADKLIETKNEGGYCLCPPSAGYTEIAGDLLNIPTVSLEVHNLLMDCARSLHTAVAPSEDGSPLEVAFPIDNVLRPGDDFNQRGDHHALLKKHGWQMSFTRGEVEYWKRSGTVKAVSANYNYVPNKFYCFSTNADPLEDRKAYDKFSLYAALEHDGNFGKAAAQLARDGFGEAREGKDKGGGTPPGANPQSEIPNPQSDWVPYSDAYNADRFVEVHGKDVLWVPQWKTWMWFDGRRWTRQTGEIVGNLMESVIRDMIDETRGMDTDDASNLLKHIASSLRQTRIKGACEIVKWRVLGDVSQFNADPFLLTCENGTLDLRTGELRDHDREDFITYLAPVEYDEDADMTFWEGILETFLPETETREFVQRAAGYSMTGLASEEVLIFPYGPTGTGKSTLLRAISAAMGDYAATADFEMLLAQGKDFRGNQPKTQLARLVGKRLVVASETDAGGRMAERMLKWITGGDTVVARNLFEREFEYVPAFTFWVAGNDRPYLDPLDDAVWRRIHQVGFDQQIPVEQQDRTVKQRLVEKELPAVLRWMMAGCLQWQKVGLRPPETVKAVTAEYRHEVDDMAQFIDERCVIDESATATIADLFDAYQDWGGKKAKRTFTQGLTKRGYASEKVWSGGKSVWGKSGIGLASDSDDYHLGSQLGDVGVTSRNAEEKSNVKASKTSQGKGLGGTLDGIDVKSGKFLHGDEKEKVSQNNVKNVKDSEQSQSTTDLEPLDVTSREVKSLTLLNVKIPIEPFRTAWVSSFEGTLTVEKPKLFRFFESLGVDFGDKPEHKMNTLLRDLVDCQVVSQESSLKFKLIRPEDTHISGIII